MGSFIGRHIELHMDRENNPTPEGPVTFDPHFGFDFERKPRVMIASEKELRACKIPKENWDYCGHLRLKLESCRADNFPFVWNCRNEAHEISMCNLDDWILRMKEYERERRLLQRAKRIREASGSA